MSRTILVKSSLRVLHVAAAVLLVTGCQSSVRIPDATPPVDLEPVTPLAGYGMELRLWALDAGSWKRIQDNAELARLYEQWQSIESTVERESSDGSDGGSPPRVRGSDEPFAASSVGPPIEPKAQLPETFEAYVRTHRSLAPQRPGMEVFDRYTALRSAVDPMAAGVWERNGFLLAVVPIGDLASLRGAMGVPGPLERTWWGATTSWSHLAKGAAAPSRRLETDLGPFVLGPGRMGLVGRAWPAPGVSQPVLGFELCPQFLPTVRGADRLEARLTARLDTIVTPPSALDEGPVFERFLLRGSLPRGYALVIVPAERDGQPVGLGPAVPASTLAESMLTTIGPDGSPRPVALVVVPVLPEWFSLDGD